MVQCPPSMSDSLDLILRTKEMKKKKNSSLGAQVKLEHRGPTDSALKSQRVQSKGEAPLVWEGRGSY